MNANKQLNAVWAYLVDHSPCTDQAITDLLAGENISHIPWTPVMHELADAVNYVLAQEASSSTGDSSNITD